jgi:hypothetical protein
VKTVWLLDVDGVVNATRPGWSAAPRHATVSDGQMSYRLRWAPALVGRIRKVHQSGLVEIWWCTTWCPWADQIERASGLPVLRRAFDHGPDVTVDETQAAKLGVALRVVDAGRRLVWTDDDAIPAGGPARAQLLVSDQALLIAPKPRVGLQPVDMDAVDAFIGLPS